MKREEIKTYKDACKVIGRKPRTYKDKHLNLYEQRGWKLHNRKL